MWATVASSLLLAAVGLCGEPPAATDQHRNSNGKTLSRPYFLQPKDVVLFLGNSITAGAQPEINFLIADFKKQYPELAEGEGRVTFNLSGQNGEQAAAGARRLKDLIEKIKPTVCVVGYGTCEVTFKNEKDYIPAMKDIIKQLSDAKVAVTIVSAPPPSPAKWPQKSPWPAEQFVKGLPEVVALARKLAEEEGLPFVDSFAALESAAGTDTKDRKELTIDGIHLNADGYRVMADALQKAWGFGGTLTKSGSPRQDSKP